MLVMAEALLTLLITGGRLKQGTSRQSSSAKNSRNTYKRMTMNQYLIAVLLCVIPASISNGASKLGETLSPNEIGLGKLIRLHSTQVQTTIPDINGRVW